MNPTHPLAASDTSRAYEEMLRTRSEQPSSTPEDSVESEKESEE